MSDEYIKKGPLMKFIEDGLNNRNPEKAFGHDAIEIMTEIQFTPAAPVREVVTCGKCAHYDAKKEFCTNLKRLVGEECYCCWGFPMPDMRTEEGGPT